MHGLSGRRRGEAGFSLIELLLVIVIIGILAAIAVPMYLGSRSRAKNADVRTGARTIAIALCSYVLEAEDRDGGDPWPPRCDQATLAAYLPADEWPRNPFRDGAPMEQVEEARLGDYSYVRETTGPQPRRYHIVAWLDGQEPFVVP